MRHFVLLFALMDTHMIFAYYYYTYSNIIISLSLRA